MTELELSDELKAEIIRSNKIDREIKQAKMDRDFAYPDYHDELHNHADRVSKERSNNTNFFDKDK